MVNTERTVASMSKEKENQKFFGVSKDALLTSDTNIYHVDILDVSRPYDDLDEDVAYVEGDFYYILRGRKPEVDDEKEFAKLVAPGIYRDSEGKQFIVHPANEREEKMYNYFDALVKYDPEQIVTVIKDKGKLWIDNVNPDKIFKAAIGDNDNILLRGMKEVFRRKNVDIRACEDRFPNKHALTNFKQTMTSPDKKNLTILLFDRGIEALNLKYTLIIEDRDADLSIGERLIEPVIVCSEDTIPVSKMAEEE